MIYTDEILSKYYNIICVAVADIQSLGYSFPSDILFVEYQGNDECIYGTSSWYPYEALVEINIDIHKNINELINTIYHELAHITMECARQGHSNAWRKLANKIYRMKKIKIKKYAEEGTYENI